MVLVHFSFCQLLSSPHVLNLRHICPVYLFILMFLLLALGFPPQVDWTWLSYSKQSNLPQIKVWIYTVYRALAVFDCL